jgi:phage terminase small subunit
MKIIVNERAIELGQEQLDLFGKLKTKLQRNTALKSLEGLCDVDAYIQGGGKAKGDNSQRASASEILCNPNIVAFIESFNAHLIAPSIMTRVEMLERLTGYARTEITDLVDIHENVIVDLPDGGQVKQSTWSLKEASEMGGAGVAAISEITASKDGIKFKIHDQKASMKQIADLEGYNAAVRLAVGGDPDGSPIKTEDASLTKDQALELLKKNGMS